MSTATLARTTLTVNYTTMEATAPVVTITSPTSSSNYTTEARRLTIAGTAEGANTIQQVIVSIPSLGLTRLASGTNDWNITGTLPHEGIYEITINAEDVYGNIGQDTITVNYTTVDATAPVSWR